MKYFQTKNENLASYSIHLLPLNLLLIQKKNKIDRRFIKYNKGTTHSNVPFSKRNLETLTVPCEWECPTYFYDANDGCDSNCGPVEDPDCLISTDLVYGCEDFELFNQCSEGQCVGEVKEVPDGWSSSRSYYDADDGCDCECGA